MGLEEIARVLSERGHYSAELDEGFLLIRDNELGSEYDLELFEQSAQIRQGLWLDCLDLPEDELGRLYVLCSLMNARFSGCKNYVDQQGVLVTTADIIGPVTDIEFVETLLNQVEFVSGAMQELVELMQREGRLPTGQELDTALGLPSLQ